MGIIISASYIRHQPTFSLISVIIENNNNNNNNWSITSV